MGRRCESPPLRGGGAVGGRPCPLLASPGVIPSRNLCSSPSPLFSGSNIPINLSVSKCQQARPKARFAHWQRQHIKFRLSPFPTSTLLSGPIISIGGKTNGSAPQHSAAQNSVGLLLLLVICTRFNSPGEEPARFHRQSYQESYGQRQENVREKLYFYREYNRLNACAKTFGPHDVSFSCNQAYT